MQRNYLTIIRSYKQWKKSNPDSWIIHCSTQISLLNAIHYAALSENNLGKRHPHQRRLEKKNMQLFERNLLGARGVIASADTFDDLLAVVKKESCYGIGELAIYDTAIRIGAYLNLQPERIYLHAGTRVGAEKLLKKKIESSSNFKNDLPEPFKSSDLSCYELDDLLCIYKAEL